MVSLAVALTLAVETLVLPAFDGVAPSATVQWTPGILLRPKISPSQKQEYYFETDGLVDLEGGVRRFRIFSQTEQTHAKLSRKVARELLRIWQLNYGRFGLDHAVRYNKQLVDVYLCETGEAGGEQLFGLDPDSRKDVNAIFIYDLKSFTDPLEMAREVAHEYGHATLPPVGGYKEGESWINGDLGEMVYLRALRDEMKAGRLVGEDVMDVALSDLGKWVSTEVDPLVTKAALASPGTQLALPTFLGRGAYLGLAAYSQTLLPAKVWRRSLTLFASTHAVDFPSAIVDAVAESNVDVILSIPANLRSSAIWIPFKNKNLLRLKVLARVDGWVKVNPGGASSIRLIANAEAGDSALTGL